MSSGRPILGCWELAFTSLPRLASIESVASDVYPMNRGSQAPELFHRWIVSVTPTALVVRDIVGTAERRPFSPRIMIRERSCPETDIWKITPKKSVSGK